MVLASLAACGTPSLRTNCWAKAPEVTRSRLYLETLEKVLGGSDKVIIEQDGGGSGVVPYLPLPEIRKNTGGNN